MTSNSFASFSAVCVASVRSCAKRSLAAARCAMLSLAFETSSFCSLESSVVLCCIEATCSAKVLLNWRRILSASSATVLTWRISSTMLSRAVVVTEIKRSVVLTSALSVSSAWALSVATASSTLAVLRSIVAGNCVGFFAHKIGGFGECGFRTCRGWRAEHRFASRGFARLR